jgi:transposase
MAAIIYQLDKRSGITYAYESISYWDKEKKQSRAKRKLIGRVNKDTNEIVPTDGRCRKDKQKKIDSQNKVLSTRQYYGATYLFDKIGKKIGLIKDLKKCFANSYKQILSTAYYLILEDNNPLMRFEKWGNTHKHPYGKNITSQRSSELFASISEDDKMNFFKLQGKRKIDNEFFAYDTTSISSYSKSLKQVQYGHNKENDKLPQINLAVVFGEKSNLPFYYRKLAGNIPDCKTVDKLLNDLDILGFNKVNLVLDRGFYSKTNIDTLYKSNNNFLISASMRLKFIKENLEPLYDKFTSSNNYNPTYELYTKTIKKSWGKDNKDIYIHYYYNSYKATNQSLELDKKLLELKTQIIDNNFKVNKSYQKYFTITNNSDNTIDVDINDDIVFKTKQSYGFFTLITNKQMSSTTALEIYRNKDVVEKVFGNLKERLNMRRTLVSCEQSLDGKLFVEFIALIYLSYIKKQMQDNNMFKDYTMQTLLDKLDVIECYKYKNNRKLQVGEVLQKQKDIYAKMGVEIIGSL